MIGYSERFAKDRCIFVIGVVTVVGIIFLEQL